MSRRSVSLVSWVAALAVSSLVAGSGALAAPPKKDTKPAAPAVPVEAPKTKVAIKLVPDGMHWGMARGDLEKLVDKFIDDDYRPKYKEVGKSAPKIKDLDAEVANKKAAFRRSWTELKPGPTGLDSSPIAPEYTKGNDEALMSHHRGPGVKIWFFFIGGRLWKTYEEVSFVDGGLYGKDMGEAAKKLVDSVSGTLPRQIPANPDKAAYYDVFDWQDDTTHMRIWDRSGVLVVVREEKSTVANLANLRKNKPAASDGLDPAVAAVLRGEKEPPKKEEKK